MSIVYEELICKLKNNLKNKNINFNDFIELINNQKYDKIIKIIDDDKTICSLIENIEIERDRIGNNMENKFNNLLWLNEIIIKFNEKPQPTKTKALKLIKSKIFINIYDLEAGKYECKTTKQSLKKELKNKPERRFPLNNAKNYITLKCFLIKL
jgi:hypothetical protein